LWAIYKHALSASVGLPIDGDYRCSRDAMLCADIVKPDDAFTIGVSDSPSYHGAKFRSPRLYLRSIVSRLNQERRSLCSEYSVSSVVV
jgi:hypothetical protein